MNKPVVRKWLDALRSGEYEQIDGKLRRDEENGRCCLGVLCDLYAEEHENAGWNNNAFVIRDAEDGSLVGSSPALLPKPVQEWAGLNSKEGIKVSVGNGTVSLSGLNDGHGVEPYSFDEIADVIDDEME